MENYKLLQSKLLLSKLFDFIDKDIININVYFSDIDTTFCLVNDSVLINRIYEDYNLLDVSYLLLWVLLILNKLVIKGNIIEDLAYILSLRLYYNELLYRLFKKRNIHIKVYKELDNFQDYREALTHLTEEELLKLPIVDIYKLIKNYLKNYRDNIINYYRTEDKNLLTFIKNDKLKESVEDTITLLKDINKDSFIKIQVKLKELITNIVGKGKSIGCTLKEVGYNYIDPKLRRIANSIKRILTDCYVNYKYTIYKIRGKHAYYLLNHNIFPLLYSIDKNTGKQLILVLDTSGSIEDKVYSTFITLVKDILYCTNIYKARVIMFSGKVLFDKEYTIQNIEDCIEEIKKRRGYGGTVFGDVLNVLKKERHKELITLIIFTDGLFSDIDEIENDIKILEEFKRVVILTNNKNIEVFKNVKNSTIFFL